MPRLQIFAGLFVLIASLGLFLFALNSELETSSPATELPVADAPKATTDQSEFGATILNEQGVPDVTPPAGMVWIPGGEFSMGSDSAAESI